MNGADFAARGGLLWWRRRLAGGFADLTSCKKTPARRRRLKNRDPGEENHTDRSEFFDFHPQIFADFLFLKIFPPDCGPYAFFAEYTKPMFTRPVAFPVLRLIQRPVEESSM